MRTVTKTPHPPRLQKFITAAAGSSRQQQSQERNYTIIYWGLDSTSTPWMIFSERG